ncbi:MAG TPA: hypothetical protein VGJ76_05535, partial [Pseudolabrys sp.]
LVFFAAFAAAFFLRLAIAALLAMDHGGYRTARIGNRHALYSVYYSTAKKTALPLNETCMHAQSHMMRGRQARKSEFDRARKTPTRYACA